MCSYTTLRYLKIQYIRPSKTIPSSSHIFFHSALSVAAEQSGSEPRRLRSVGILQERVYKHHRITGRGRAAPACRGRMRPSVPVSDRQRISEWRKRLPACIAGGGGHFEH